MSNIKKWKKSKKIKNQIKKDNLYRSYWLRKFLNIMTKQGQKHKSEIILYNIFYNLKKKKLNPLTFIFFCILNSKWLLTTHMKRFGKHWHHLPSYISYPRSINKGISSIIWSSKISDYKEKNFSKKLWNELWHIYALDKKSLSFKARNEKIELVIQNKAYMHFRWK